MAGLKRGPARAVPTEELTDKIEEAVREIGFLSPACRMHGVRRELGEDWMARGKAGDPDCERFYQRISIARALHEQSQLKALSDPKWKLERMNRSLYAPPKDRVELSGGLRVDVSSMSDAELDAIIAGKAAPQADDADDE